MTNLAKTLTRLRHERKQSQQQVEKLDDAINALEVLGQRDGRPAGRATRTLSAAGRRRIAQAQKARWAKWKAKRKKKAT